MLTLPEHKKSSLLVIFFVLNLQWPFQVFFYVFKIGIFRISFITENFLQKAVRRVLLLKQDTLTLPKYTIGPRFFVWFLLLSTCVLCSAV